MPTAPNLEARARRLRYAALRRLAAAHGCAQIATGHTLDDQAETVLMRLVRGAGVRGLAAIRPRRRDGIVRPVIDCRRADLRAVVEQAGLPFRHDASNDDPRFLRTQVRQRVLPLLAELNPAVAEACANLAASARAEGAAVARWADAELAAAESEDGLPVAWLADQPAEARTLLARRWLVRAGAAAAAPRPASRAGGGRVGAGQGRAGGSASPARLGAGATPRTARGRTA